MQIKELFARDGPIFSFEFFPPKTDRGLEALYGTIERLKPLHPDFVSVTYGAGGSTRQRTVELVVHIKREIGIEAMAHLTCVGASRSEIAAVLDELRARGIENVLALRGDPPRDQPEFTPHPDGFAHASELAAFIRERGDPFCVGGACYPEGHIEAPDLETDLDHLVAKVKAGVDFLITQLFFDNRHYFDFVERARTRGIQVPILPGIMPVTNAAQVERFTKICGASIPPDLQEKLDAARDREEEVLRIGVEHATRQCLDLLARGAPGIHFYTLNQSPATRAILQRLRA